MARSTSSSKSTARLRSQVGVYASQQQNNTFNYKQVSHAIGAATPAAQRSVAMILAEMAFDGDLIEVAPGKYKYPQRGTIAEGVFTRRSNGKNSVTIDPDGEVLMVAERNSMHALNGDRVLVNIAARRRGVEAEAEVIDILEKKEQSFIGTLKVERGFGLLQTDSKFLATDIIIPKSRLKGGKTGDKAIVKITDWPADSKNPKGTVVDILGKTGENNAEIHAILAEFGLPYHYPENVEEEASKIDAGITDEVVASRIDMRGVPTFTIDPKDAKDFDDALSFRRLKNGNYEIGVHIADVTHYVRPGSILDKEAQSRATSVYLVDRVVPMLPEHLSNGICSLRPDEDKLTFSCIFEMTPAGKIVNSKIARTVIRSNRRFTYEEAQDVIETGKGDYADEILELDRLAKILRKARYENGSVEFDRVEVRFDIDENGHPTGVFFKESKDANKLIEEFMLLANKTVARSIGQTHNNKKPKAFVYRVHDQPDPGKLADLAQLSRTFGYKIKTDGKASDINRSINKMLADVKGKGEENFLSTLAIRSMAKAIYTTTNIGHYGLGFDYYTHFTSPIRRYPDMMVHRLLERYLDGGRSVNVDKLEEQCKHSSDMEQLAANAERASIKFKQVEYMKDHMGEVYDGIITGVTEWGLYVELNDNKCEGLIPVRDLTDDYYDFDEKNYCLIGRRKNNRFRLGDEIKVRVARADVDKKQLDFALVDPSMMRNGQDLMGFVHPEQKKSKNSFKKSKNNKSGKKTSQKNKSHK
ncbi:MAG: ribonuclease R [Muribaculaceae bacterium]|nr:ribonuclease R [Muribaculaceae bacterium]